MNQCYHNFNVIDEIVLYRAVIMLMLIRRVFHWTVNQRN